MSSDFISGIIMAIPFGILLVIVGYVIGTVIYYFDSRSRPTKRAPDAGDSDR